MKASGPTVSHPRLYSLCVEPIGEREAGESRPTWPISMECFLLRDWLLAGGGVGHLRRPLVVCELYGLPDGGKKGDVTFTEPFLMITNRKVRSHFLFLPLGTELQGVVVEIYPYEIGHPFTNAIHHQ